MQHRRFLLPLAVGVLLVVAARLAAQPSPAEVPSTPSATRDGKAADRSGSTTERNEAARKADQGEGGERTADREKAEAAEPAEETDRRPLWLSFDDGVLISSRSGDFQLRLHLMEQTDFKLFLPTFQEPARSGMYIPRFRVYFEGQATRTFEYELSLQRSVEGTFDVLDANINLHLTDAFQVKVGRFLVPYSYDWYDHLEQYFLTPERGLFPLNFGLSREAGVMAWGTVDGGRVQYAVGGFDGQLAGLADTNTTRDGVGYLNLRPFVHDAGSPWRFLNVGGSVALGKQAYREAPLPLRTSIQSSENDEAAQAASAIFLDFLPGVTAYGGRFQAAAHLAWYYRQLSVEGEWQVGRFGYSREGLTPTTHLRASGFHLGAGYFLTGEEVEKRTVVVPLRPFDPRGGQWGPGAVELFARYSQLTLGNEVFTADLADPDRWSRSAYMTDVGVNWYPNRYVKFYLDWQHALFGSPVVLYEEQDRYRRRNDLFWLRCQIWY